MKIPAYIKIPLLIGGNVTAAIVASSAISVYMFTSRDKSPVKKHRKIAGVVLKNIELISRDGVKISAWLAAGEEDKSVVLLSGRGSNRDKNVAKARFYIKRGFTVLMPDLRGTGESGGDKITMGWLERFDLLACIDYLKNKGYTQIGAHGFSIGAAAICYSLTEYKDYSFVVLESCYADFRKLVGNGLNLRYLPTQLSLSILPMLSKWLKVNIEQLKPIEYLPEYHAPLLILAGGKDKLVKKEEILRLFDSNKSSYSRLHFFNKGKHQNYSMVYRRTYKKVLAGFLDGVS